MFHNADPVNIRNRIEEYTEDRDLQMLFKAVYLLGAKECEMLGEKYATDKSEVYGPTADDSWEGPVLVNDNQIDTVFFKIRTARIRTAKIKGKEERVVWLPRDCEPWAKELHDYFKEKGSNDKKVFPFNRVQIRDRVIKSKVLDGLKKSVIYTGEKKPKDWGLDDLRFARKDELETRYRFRGVHLNVYGFGKIDKRFDESKKDELKKDYLLKLCNIEPKKEGGNILFVEGKRIDVNDLIAKGENEKTEFKFSLCWDYKERRKNKIVEQAVAKAIASFLNSNGGVLLIGVKDDKTLLGIEADFSAINKPTEDAFDLHFTNIIENYLGIENRPYVTMRFTERQGKKIAVVVIPKKAPKEVFLTLDDEPFFYVRSGNSSRSLNIKEAIEYVRQHWEARAILSKRKKEFRTNNSKLVEKIYEPLSSILEKHTEQLKTFSCPFAYEVKDILGKTYYKMQMPLDLLERLEHYTNQVEALYKEEHYARRVMVDVLNRIALEILKKPYSAMGSSLKIEFIALSKTGNQLPVYPQDIFRLLLENQKLEDFLRKNYWSDNYEHISIKYSNEPSIELEWIEFNEKIWNKSLAEVSANPKITQFKKSTESILEEARDIIEEITKN